MTIDQAKQLKSGDWIYSTVSFDRKGNPHRAKVTSVKTWKRSPNRIEVRWKHGLYLYGTANQYNLSEWEVES